MKKAQGFVLNRSLPDAAFRPLKRPFLFCVGLSAASPAKDLLRITADYHSPDIDQTDFISKK